MDDFVLCLGGGAMSGVFGGGICAGVRNLELWEKIKAIHAGSVGIFNGGYAGTDQADVGLSLYTEEMTRGFLYPIYVFNGLTLLYYRHILGNNSEEFRRSLKTPVRIDYVLDMVRSKKKLDIEKLKIQSIPIYAKLLDVDNGEVFYQDLRELDDPLFGMKAGISIVPYYPFSQEVNGRRCIDGTIKEPIGLQYLLSKYPDDKIIVAINDPIERNWRHWLKVSIEGLVADSCYNIPLGKYYHDREIQAREDIELARRTERVLLLHPPKERRFYPKTTDPEKLWEGRRMGEKEAEKIVEFLESKKARTQPL